MKEELVKDLVKFYVLRYATSLIVSRTVTGKHKVAYVDLMTIDAIENTVDVLREHRGEYMPIEIIEEEVAKRMGYKVRRKKTGEITILYQPPGAKKARRLSEDTMDKFRRTVSYALNGLRDLFGIAELVKRPGRESPERYVSIDRSKNLASRLNDVVERIDKITEYLTTEESAYICPNLECSVIELYRSNEAEMNEYKCKGKSIERIEYGEAENVIVRLEGCGSDLDEVDVYLLEEIKSLLNAIVERISK